MNISKKVFKRPKVTIERRVKKIELDCSSRVPWPWPITSGSIRYDSAAVRPNVLYAKVHLTA